MPNRSIIPYEPHLKELARQLRHSMTISERALWQHLRRNQMVGIDFHRQRPLDRYIVDFYAPDIGLAIEIDGLTHDVPERSRADVLRQQRIEAHGVQFLRFADNEVTQNIWAVLDSIETWILTNHPEKRRDQERP
jgi:very-short-patch-repair endonuclease